VGPLVRLHLGHDREGIIRSSLQKKLVEEGAEPAVAGCVAERVASRVPDRTLRAVLRGGGKQELRDLAREAARSCTAPA
jgi:hypothetical protein